MSMSVLALHVMKNIIQILTLQMQLVFAFVIFSDVESGGRLAFRDA